jgi:hypothetical protein
VGIVKGNGIFIGMIIGLVNRCSDNGFGRDLFNSTKFSTYCIFF